MEKAKASCPVNSHNEWDPLEEVIVGALGGAMFPDWNTINRATVSPGEWLDIERKVGGAGSPYPADMVQAAQRDLDGFIQVLEAEGVRVRQMAPSGFSTPYQTPAWQVGGGFCAANPRDPFLVIGDEIIETPMTDRNRHFEADFPFMGTFHCATLDIRRRGELCSYF